MIKVITKILKNVGDVIARRVKEEFEIEYCTKRMGGTERISNLFLSRGVIITQRRPLHRLTTARQHNLLTNIDTLYT